MASSAFSPQIKIRWRYINLLLASLVTVGICEYVSCFLDRMESISIQNDPGLAIVSTWARKKFGEDFSLRLEQKELLSSLLLGKSILARLPTGYGKSFCFAAPALAWNWKVVVVVPLIALIQDQLRRWRPESDQVIGFYHGQMESEKSEDFKKFQSGRWNLCFLSPERLIQWQQTGVLALGLKSNGTYRLLVVLDEMHTLEQWKHFRKSMEAVLQPIDVLISRGAQVLGLSASFSNSELSKWRKRFDVPFQFISTELGKENLYQRILPLQSPNHGWLLLLQALKGLVFPSVGLVYCSTQKECDEVFSWLVSIYPETATYHAGLDSKRRRDVLEQFQNGRLRIVVATVAFGMGVDYPHVDRVVHFSLPYSLNNYWQEAGRAGRLGQPALSLVLWRRSEILRLQRMNFQAREHFCNLLKAFAAHKCRKKVVGEALGLLVETCDSCDQCLRLASGFKKLQLKILQENCFIREFFFESSIFSPWWLEEEADFSAWVDKKNYHVGKILDDC